MEYGTGAIMAVPGHDERDFEFAQKFDAADRAGGRRARRGQRERGDCESAPTSTTSAGVLVNSGAVRRHAGARRPSAPSPPGWQRARPGRPCVNYRLHDWCISRQRYWGPPIPIIYCDEHGAVPVPEKDLPVVLPIIDDFRPDDTGVSPLARHEEWYHVPCPVVRQARPARDRRHRHVPRLGVVLPALPEHRVRRPPVRPGAHGEVAARSPPTSAATSTPCCTCCTRASSRWC